MCCRFYMEMSPKLRPIVEAAQQSRLYQNNVSRIAKPLAAEGDVYPEMLVPVLASDRAGRPSVFPMIWGYHFDGLTHPVVNARSETAPEKPGFKEGWAAHRCIIPASWYYEWQHIAGPGGRTRAGEKYAILPRGSDVTWLCGVYRMEDAFPHFVILTREPGEAISFIHNRMPVILPEKDVAKWIDPQMNPHMLLSSALTDMVFEKASITEEKKLRQA